MPKNLQVPIPDRVFDPTFDRVVVWRHEADDTTASGLLIVPDTAKIKTCTASVIAVGPGRIDANGDRVTPSVVAGDEIIIGRYIGTEISMKVGNEEKKFVFITEDEIFAILR